jgi:hypothetical protein
MRVDLVPGARMPGTGRLERVLILADPGGLPGGGAAGD